MFFHVFSCRVYVWDDWCIEIHCFENGKTQQVSLQSWPWRGLSKVRCFMSGWGFVSGLRVPKTKRIERNLGGAPCNPDRERGLAWAKWGRSGFFAVLCLLAYGHTVSSPNFTSIWGTQRASIFSPSIWVSCKTREMKDQPCFPPTCTSFPCQRFTSVPFFLPSPL